MTFCKREFYLKYHHLSLPVSACWLLALPCAALAQERAREPDTSQAAKPDASTDEAKPEPRAEFKEDEQPDKDEGAQKAPGVQEAGQSEQAAGASQGEQAPEEKAPDKGAPDRKAPGQEAPEQEAPDKGALDEEAPESKTPDKEAAELEQVEQPDPFAAFDQAFEQEAGEEADGVDEEEAGAASVQVHGSLENQLTGIYLRRYRRRNRWSLNDYTRLRIDVDADLPGQVQVRSDAVARLFVGETELDIVDLIPAKTFDELISGDARSVLVTGDGQPLSYGLEDELYIDNAYMKVPAGSALLAVGKQPLEQGAGYVWNPTDVFIDKDIFDPTYEKAGVIAVRATIPIGGIASVDGMAVPEGPFKHWSAGGRASLRLGPLTLGPACFLTREEQTDLTGSIATAMLAGADLESAMDNITVVDAQRVMVGGEAILDVEGVRLWVEGAHNFVEEKTGAPDDWWELVGGVEYFFEFETHVMAEYYHYARGPRQRNGTYDLNAWMGLLAAELKMLGNDFVFATVDHPVADFWTAGLSSIQSFTDLSATIMVDVRWDFIEDGEIWLVLAGNVGESGDLLSASPGQGWLRAKVYF